MHITVNNEHIDEHIAELYGGDREIP